MTEKRGSDIIFGGSFFNKTNLPQIKMSSVNGFLDYLSHCLETGSNNFIASRGHEDSRAYLSR